MRIFGILGLCAVLGGCLKPDDEPLIPNPWALSKADREAFQQKVAAKDDEVCRGYGAKPGTDVYVQCRMAQVQHRDAGDRGDGGVSVVNGQPGVPPSDAPVLRNILPPTVRCQTVGPQTICR
jgi:hypothetical protein